MEPKEGNCPKDTEILAIVSRSLAEHLWVSMNKNLTLIHNLHQHLESNQHKQTLLSHQMTEL